MLNRKNWRIQVPQPPPPPPPPYLYKNYELLASQCFFLSKYARRTVVNVRDAILCRVRPVWTNIFIQRCRSCRAIKPVRSSNIFFSFRFARFLLPNFFVITRDLQDHIQWHEAMNNIVCVWMVFLMYASSADQTYMNKMEYAKIKQMVRVQWLTGRRRRRRRPLPTDARNVNS